MDRINDWNYTPEKINAPVLEEESVQDLLGEVGLGDLVPEEDFESEDLEYLEPQEEFEVEDLGYCPGLDIEEDEETLEERLNSAIARLLIDISPIPYQTRLDSLRKEIFDILVNNFSVNGSEYNRITAVDKATEYVINCRLAGQEFDISKVMEMLQAPQVETAVETKTVTRYRIKEGAFLDAISDPATVERMYKAVLQNDPQLAEMLFVVEVIQIEVEPEAPQVAEVPPAVEVEPEPAITPEPEEVSAIAQASEPEPAIAPEPEETPPAIALEPEETPPAIAPESEPAIALEPEEPASIKVNSDAMLELMESQELMERLYRAIAPSDPELAAMLFEEPAPQDPQRQEREAKIKEVEELRELVDRIGSRAAAEGDSARQTNICAEIKALHILESVPEAKEWYLSGKISWRQVRSCPKDVQVAATKLRSFLLQ